LRLTGNRATRCLHEKEGPERSQRLETGTDTPLSLARQGLLSCELLSTQAAEIKHLYSTILHLLKIKHGGPGQHSCAPLTSLCSRLYFGEKLSPDKENWQTEPWRDKPPSGHDQNQPTNPAVLFILYTIYYIVGIPVNHSAWRIILPVLLVRQ